MRVHQPEARENNRRLEWVEEVCLVFLCWVGGKKGIAWKLGTEREGGICRGEGRIIALIRLFELGDQRAGAGGGNGKEKRLRECNTQDQIK